MSIRFELVEPTLRRRAILFMAASALGVGAAALGRSGSTDAWPVPILVLAASATLALWAGFSTLWSP